MKTLEEKKKELNDIFDTSKTEDETLDRVLEWIEELIEEVREEERNTFRGILLAGRGSQDIPDTRSLNRLLERVDSLDRKEVS